MKVLAVVLAMLLQFWNGLSYQEQVEADIETQASVCGLTVDEFTFLASVVEAESDRSTSTDGKVLIAETVFNRVNSPAWPNSVTGVLCQYNQFTVVSAGIYKQTGCTETSRWAVVEAYKQIYYGDAPNVIYFNCIGFNGMGVAYDYVDGNYFELG